MVSDPILLFLTVDAIGLLLLGACTDVLPPAVSAFLATLLSGLGVLVCLTALILRAPTAAVELPFGPPGLSLHLALDSLSAFFLLVVFQIGTILGVLLATATPALPLDPVPALSPAPVLSGAPVLSAGPEPAAASVPAAASGLAGASVPAAAAESGASGLASFATVSPALIRITALCVAGAAVAMLAADGVTLVIGLAISGGCIRLARLGRIDRVSMARSSPDWSGRWLLLAPVLVLVAICLLSPAGSSLRFDAIRAVPIDAGRAIAAGALTFAAVAGMICGDLGERCWARDALAAGVLIPSGSYLLMRLMVDFGGVAPQPWCGFVLLLAGGVIAVIQGWRAAKQSDIDASAGCLARRQGGVAMAGIGLALIARLADLPNAEAFALAATFLSSVGGSLAGVLTVLAAHSISAGAGTRRLSRLGGLVQTMPAASAGFAVGLLGLSAIPPGLGFASLWLQFEAILLAPRTGGLLLQLPLALTGAALALSAALATAASVRLGGIALLGRPRTPQGAGARESKSPSGKILLILAAVTGLAGALPGVVLWLLADPAIQALTEAPPGARIGLALLVPSIASPSYLALPVLALLALATFAAMQMLRRSRDESKAAGVWLDGMAPPVGLPFGEPAAQSMGDGFLPVLPDLPLPRIPRLPGFARIRPPGASAGLWLVLAGFGLLLLVVALSG